jgi:hypothetical protein
MRRRAGKAEGAAARSEVFASSSELMASKALEQQSSESEVHPVSTGHRR